MSVKTLIDNATKTTGTRYKLAKAMGLTPSNIYDWEEGRKTCSPGDRARLAGFANEDAVQELVRATLETAKGSIRREQLQQILGKSLRATGAVAVSVLPSLISLAYGVNYFIRCIVVLTSSPQRVRC